MGLKTEKIIYMKCLIDTKVMLIPLLMEFL